jgi:hypothetical protein
MKFNRDSVPPVVENIAKNLFDKTNRSHIQENYKLTLMAIRSYCDDMIREYEKHRQLEDALGKKKRA